MKMVIIASLLLALVVDAAIGPSARSLAVQVFAGTLIIVSIYLHLFVSN